MKNIDSKKEILKRAKELRDTMEYKRVCISPDLTRLQQDADKDLGDRVSDFRDKERRMQIKSGKIVKICCEER